MDKILAGLPYAFVYLDDVLVASEDHVQHRQHLKEVFQLLQKGMVINREKCVFEAEEAEFLGPIVNKEGIRPLPTRVSAITAYPQPSTKGELTSYLGMLNFYRRFLKSAAYTLKLLTGATRGAGGKNAALNWTPEMRAAFNESKIALAWAATLAHPVADAELCQAVDASNHHVGQFYSRM